MSGPQAEDGEGATAPALRIVSRNVTAAESAAVLAVVQSALEETAADRAAKEPSPSAWQRSQRPLRRPLEPGPGSWRRSIG